MRVSQKRRHAFQLAEALKLDMTQAGWVTRADNYLSRVTKSMIVAAVSEAKGEATAELLADLKKKEMAIEAERLLNGTGWLPEPLRMPAPSTKRRLQRFRPSSTRRRRFKPPNDADPPRPEEDEGQKPGVKVREPEKAPRAFLVPQPTARPHRRAVLRFRSPS